MGLKKEKGGKMFEREDEKAPSVEQSKKALIEDDDLLAMEDVFELIWKEAE